MILKIENVFKTYNGIAAISGVALDVEKGERLVILGPSGCGKTTLIRLVAGFIQPDEGKILIENKIVSDNRKCLLEPENREVGMVFQDLALWPHMNVYENLAFGLKAKKIPKPAVHQRIDEILEKMQMMPFQRRFPKELSGGQQQRVALARALVMRPKILLMDEPLSNLDFELNSSLRKEILKLQEEFKTTLIYVTHDRDEAFSLATRVVVMGHGRIQKIGSVKDITNYIIEMSKQC